MSSQPVWCNPVPYQLMPTADPDSFKTMPRWVTGLPLPPHPGAFGVQRRFHVHEGVDIYMPQSAPVFAVEDGEVVAIAPFTGPKAGLPHWLDTRAVWVEGASGVVLYGEIAPHVKLGRKVHAGDVVGVVLRVLRHDKGRPTSMLHLELHTPGSREAPEWTVPGERPAVLRDPTPFLAECVSLFA